MEYKDYYKILGVEKKASEKEIKEAYKKLAKKYHPDINKEKGAEKKFKEINEANEVLGDKTKREQYDLMGSDWDKYQAYGEQSRSYRDRGDVGGQTFYGNDFSDFFEIFFGGKGTGSTSTGARFDNIFGGAPKQKTNTRQKTTYQNPQTRQTSHQHKSEEATELEVSIKEAFDGGKKQVRVGDKELKINIPRGVDDGTKMRIPTPNGTDIYLKIKLKDSAFFKLEKKDITCEVPVTDYEVVLGTEISVPTLAGTSVTLKVPPESQSGKTFRLKNMGMYHVKSDQRGDMYIKLKVSVPKNLTEKEKELFEQLKTLRVGKDTALRENLV